MTLERNPHGFPDVPKDAFVCNCSRPMPTNRDQVGHHWYHVDAKPQDDTDDDELGNKRASPCVWYCVNCNHSWSGPASTSTDPDYRAPPTPIMRTMVDDSLRQGPYRVTYGFKTSEDRLRFNAAVSKMVDPAPAKPGKRFIVMQGSSQSSPSSHWVKYRFQSRADRDEFVNRVNMNARYSYTVGVNRPAPTDKQVDELRVMIMNVSAGKWVTSTTAASNVRVRNMLEAIWRMDE